MSVTPIGAPIRPGYIRDANTGLYYKVGGGGGGGGGGGVTEHSQLLGLGADDHLQYARADGTRGNFETAGALSAHVAAADPHPQYLTQTEGDGRFLQLTGGALSGNLYLNGKHLHVDGAAGTGRSVYFDTNGVSRWVMLASGDGETGGDRGSNFQIARFNDAGQAQAPSIAIDRSNGDVVMAGLWLNTLTPTQPNHATSKQYVDTQRDTRVLKTGDTMTGALRVTKTWIGNVFGGGTYAGMQAEPVGFGGSAGPAILLGDGGADGHVYMIPRSDGDVFIRPRGDPAKQWQFGDTSVTALTPLTLPADPTLALQAATKQYVDGKVGGGGPPTGTASGDLSGNYPSPQIAAGVIVDADVNASAAIAQSKIATLVTDLAAKQPLDADLTTIAGLTATTGNIIQSVGSAWASQTPTQVKTSLALTKTDVGLANVDNTSDVNKPVSTAQAAADALKANIASPTLTGVPLSTTAAVDTNTTQIATTAYVIGQGYQKQAATDARYLQLTGGTLTNFLTLSADPISALHAATKQYVDISSQGFSFKQAVRVVSTVNQAAISGLLTIDGVTVAAGNRVLLAAQTTASQNGVYIAASGAWTRSTDMDASGELVDGTLLPVAEGTANLDSQWMCTATGASPWVPGTSTSTWTKFSSLQDLQAGAGLLRTGNIVDVVSATADLTVQADTITVVSAPKWTTGRTVALTGDVTGTSVAFDGTAALSFVTAIGAGVIVDADVNAAAAIATSKISGLDAALTAKAPLASPTFTGVPLSTTAAVDTNTTQIATTAFVVGQGYLKSASASGLYQPLDSDLTTLAGLTATTGNMILSVGSAWASQTPAQVKTVLTLDQVSNTSDANKPVSTAQQTALNLKADLISPTFTGTPVAPTATVGTNTTQLATTAFVLANGTSLATTDARYLQLTGGTLTGNLVIDNAGAASLVVDRGSSSVSGWIQFATAGAGKWEIGPSGGGSDDFYLVNRGAGGVIALYGSVTTSLLSVAGDPTANLGIATKQYVDLKAPLASPTFTGVPAAPTATIGTNTTQLATTAFVLANASGGHVIQDEGVTLTARANLNFIGSVTATDNAGSNRTDVTIVSDVTVSTSAPVGTPSRDGILWVVVA